MATAKKKTARHSKVSASAPKASALGKKIDALYEAREKRLVQQRALDALAQKEHDAKQEVITLLNAQNLTGGKGTRASVTLQPKLVPKADPAHWNDVFAFIAKHEHWELLHKRLNSGSYRELIEGGEQVPHVTAETVLELSIKKVS